MTSAKNRDFVDRLNCCDDIVIYGEEQKIDAGKAAAYVDMSGDVRLTKFLHNHLASNMRESCIVGATHWEEGGHPGELPGVKPRFFFAPAQIAKREKDWGSGVIMSKASHASAGLAEQVSREMTIEWTRDVNALKQLWLDLLDNKVSGDSGNMVSLLS